MLLTLLKATNATKLKDVVPYLSMSPLDIDLLLYDAQEAGEVEVDKEKGTIIALKEPAFLYHDKELAQKLLKIIRKYDEQEANITRTRLEQITLDLMGKHGYPIHDFVCTLYALEQGKANLLPKVNKYDISVPEIKDKLPANTFTFYTLTDHQEFGAKAVNEFIDTFSESSVK